METAEEERVPRQTGRGILVSTFFCDTRGNMNLRSEVSELLSKGLKVWFRGWVRKRQLLRSIQFCHSSAFEREIFTFLKRQTVTYVPLRLSKAHEFTFGTKAIAVTTMENCWKSHSLRHYNAAASEELTGSTIVTCYFTFSPKWSSAESKSWAVLW